jgi:hypothetical protein
MCRDVKAAHNDAVFGVASGWQPVTVIALAIHTAFLLHRHHASTRYKEV